MAKYNPEIVARICSLTEKDSFTVAEICDKVGIAISTYYEWQESKAEFSEAIKRAKDKYDDNMLIECNKSLAKLIRGYDYEEKKTVYVDSKEKDGTSKPKIKEQTTTKKHVSPNLGAIIHFQTNIDPETWKNKQSTEISGKLSVNEVPDEELDARIAELEKKLKG